MSGLEKIMPGRRGQQREPIPAVVTNQPEPTIVQENKGDDTSTSGKAGGRHQPNGGVLEDNQGASFDGNNPQYKHWNIFFKDIYRVSIDIVDRETNSIISQQDLERLLHNNAAIQSDRQLKIFFVLKIYY